MWPLYAEPASPPVASPASASPAAASQELAPIGSWSAVVAFDRHLFPSLLLVTSHPGFQLLRDKWQSEHPVLGEPFGWLSVIVQAPRDGCPVKVVVTSKNLMEESIFEGVIDDASEAFRINPKIAWNFDALPRYRQPSLENITFEVFFDGRPAGRQVETVQVRSINDCPMAYADEETGEELDTSWMMAAYVNEDHPWIDGLLKDALATKVIDGFYGYQTGEPADVLSQVFAIWYTLQRKGIRYSSIDPVSAYSDKITSQHVRFLDETITYEQANCLDGCVLLAAVLRKIGLEPFLVNTPSHVFLAFSLGAETDEIAFLETTRLGELDIKQTEPDPATGPRALARRKVKEAKDVDKSWRSFSAALEAGEEAFAAIRKRIMLHDPDHPVIDIGAARRQGVMPIAFRH
jgi:hypothetical protein